MNKSHMVTWPLNVYVYILVGLNYDRQKHFKTFLDGQLKVQVKFLGIILLFSVYPFAK